MAYPIVWSAEAEQDLKAITNYIKEEWSVETADKFLSQTLGRLEKLASMPFVARHTSVTSIYMYKIDRKNVVFFTLQEDYLILLSIYPYKKDLTKSKYY